MDTDKRAKRARIARGVGFVCLGLALLNAILAVWAMVDEKDVHRGTRGLLIAVSVFIVGMVNLERSKPKPPPDA